MTAQSPIELQPPRDREVAARSQPIRALVVMPLAEQRGGGELMLLHLIEHGRGLGVEWTVAFFSEGPMADAVRGWGVPVRIVPAGRLRQPHRMAGAILRLRQLIMELHAEVVVTWMGKAHLYGGAAAALARVPAVWYQLGLPDPPCWQDRVATALPSRVVLTCSDTSTAAQEKLWPRRPTRTVHPGVDLTRFDPARWPSPAECRRTLGLSASGPLVGIVGRLQRWKGMHHLVEAMPTILQKHPDAHAVIVGGEHEFEPDYPAVLKQRIAALALEQRVILAGLQSNVPQWMMAMDVVVHASDAEPFGIVVIEAMALGKPTVATNTAGPSEIITDGVNGFLWRVGEVPSLAAKVLAALEASSEETLADAARRRARDFSAQAYARNTIEAIRAAVGRPDWLTEAAAAGEGP